MGNIVSYIEEYGSYTFDDMEFNEVDSLVLAQMSYLYYDAFIIDIPFTVTIDTIKKSRAKKTLKENTLRPKSNEKLIKAICNSKRYKEVALGYYVNELDKDGEKQFCAITFRLPDEKTYYVAFRGTDTTFIGWKEDLNMAFMSAVPAQVRSVKYLKDVLNKIPDGDFLVGGHSKGGNLAIYSVANLTDDERARVISVYNHDGPGFRHDVISSENFEKTKPLVKKTVPETSVVGMLLQEHFSYSAVASNSVGILQHDPFFWTVEENHFVHLETTSDASKFTDVTLNEWLNNMDDETRKVVIESIYNAITATKSFTFKKFSKNFAENTAGAINAIKDADPQVKDLVSKTFLQLAKFSGDEMKNIFNRKRPKFNFFKK
jgi:hypothetical protein